MDAVAGKHVLRGFGMAARDAIDVAGEIEPEPRHIEPIVAGKLLQSIDLDKPGQELLEQIVTKSVVAGFDRCMGREYAPCPDIATS
jgi:hypothetical protein